MPSGPGTPEIGEGGKILLGYAPDAPPQVQCYFADFQRDRPLLVLGALFAVAVVALGCWRRVRALAALAASLVVVIEFVLASILEGHSPVAVAVVGSAAVMLVVLDATDGLNARATVAALGTLASLALIALLAAVFVAVTKLTGSRPRRRATCGRSPRTSASRVCSSAASSSGRSASSTT